MYSERKPLVCYNCSHTIEENENYSPIHGNSYCEKCADEYAKDELAETFDEHKDELYEILGIPQLVNCEGC